MNTDNLNQGDKTIFSIIEKVPKDSDNAVIYLRFCESKQQFSTALRGDAENIGRLLFETAIENETFAEELLLSAKAYKKHLELQSQHKSKLN